MRQGPVLVETLIYWFHFLSFWEVQNFNSLIALYPLQTSIVKEIKSGLNTWVPVCCLKLDCIFLPLHPIWNSILPMFNLPSIHYWVSCMRKIAMFQLKREYKNFPVFMQACKYTVALSWVRFEKRKGKLPDLNYWGTCLDLWRVSS